MFSVRNGYWLLVGSMIILKSNERRFKNQSLDFFFEIKENSNTNKKAEKQHSVMC